MSWFCFCNKYQQTQKADQSQPHSRTIQILRYFLATLSTIEADVESFAAESVLAGTVATVSDVTVASLVDGDLQLVRIAAAANNVKIVFFIFVCLFG